MWSDTLLAAERAHLTRLLAWGAASVVAGSVVLLLLAARRGALAAAVALRDPDAGVGRHRPRRRAGGAAGLAQRDVSGATRLDRLIWFNNGLDVGYVAVGLTLAIVGWLLGRRLGLIGGGIGVVVQGLALLVLDLRFAADLARML
jgi:hypothetical protein